ncbi:MAG: DUF2312 domain-containing protein [Magnetococcales bacterium]|nr:DUF2312 domain-containing protein [Magnetococcales bacterium]
MADVGGITGDQLEQYIDRIERMEEEKAELSQDIRDLYLEAKGNGFDPKVMRKIVSIRKKDQHEIDEEEAILYLYRQALGMLPSTLQ